jgi:cell division protein FtsX
MRQLIIFLLIITSFTVSAQGTRVDTAAQRKEIEAANRFIDSVSKKTTIADFSKWCDENLSSKQNRELPFSQSYNLFLKSAWDNRKK